MDNMTDFYLAGHSYGGYLVGLYALEYPEHLRKLLLISPIGYQFKPPNWSYEITRFRGRRAGPPSWAYCTVDWTWRNKITPFKAVRFLGYGIARGRIKAYVNER